MNKAVVSEWITQLRYGDYTLAKHALKMEKKDGTICFCATGVLCDMAEKVGVVEPSVKLTDANYYRWGSNAAFLPDEVREWAGLPKLIEHKVTRMNDDGEGWNNIARYLEKLLLEEA